MRERCQAVSAGLQGICTEGGHRNESHFMSCGGQHKLNRKLTIGSFEGSEERIDGLLDQIGITCEIIGRGALLQIMLAGKQDGPTRTHC